jgi:soluble P-type ATPase
MEERMTLMNRHIVDTDDDGVVIKDKNLTINMFDNDKGYMFRIKSHSIKQYHDIKLSSIVTCMEDYSKVHLLAESIYKDTNCIAVRINSRRVRMADIDDIANMIGLSVRRSRDFITRMKKLHVIAERMDMIGDVVSTKYVFNPLFFNSSKYLSAELYFLFQESIDCYLPTWVSQRFHEYGNIKKE